MAADALGAGGSAGTVQRSGTWCAGKLSGEYRASRGPTDDYLELHLSNGRFTRPHLRQVRVRADNVSVRRHDSGRRLAVMRLKVADQPHTEHDWLGELAGLLAPALPKLRLDPEPANVEAPESTRPGPLDLPAGDAREALLPRAAGALEQGRMRDAEQLGQQAQAAGVADAREFLDTLRAIRRASKLVSRWPRDAQGHLSLAQAYFLADAGALAMREAGEALRLDASLGEAQALIGLESFYRGDRDEATRTWERARELAPSGEWQKALGVLLTEQPDADDAAPEAADEDQPLWRSAVRPFLPLLQRLGRRGRVG
jgi:tetratricopeptide (TPR) repeat protein